MISPSNQTALFSTAKWYKTEHLLPLPGVIVLHISDHGIHEHPQLSVGVVINDCAGNRDNEYYGSMAANTIYWADLPDTPIPIGKNSDSYYTNR